MLGFVPEGHEPCAPLATWCFGPQDDPVLPLLFADDAFFVSVVDRVTVSYFSGEVRDVHIDHAVDIVQKHPTNYTLSILGKQSLPPSPSQRKRITSAYTEACPGIVVVFLQTGFRGAVARSASTAMQFLLRPTFPIHSTASIQEGVDRIGRTVDVPTAATIAATIRAHQQRAA